MDIQFSNNGHSTLAASIASGDTSITVASGHGSRFPSLTGSQYFYATLIDSSNNLEIVKVTARSSDVLTVTRAQESTTARAYAIGDRIELRATAAGFNAIYTEAVADSVTGDGDYGDITVSSSGTVWTIDNNVVDASALNVSGNGSSGQYLISDGDGSFSWQTLSVAEYSVATNATTTNRTLNGDSGWVTHLTTTFTTTQSCTVLCFANFAHGYESGAVDTAGRFNLDSGTLSQQVQIFKQGFGSNMSFGAHSMAGFFTSVSAGSHTITTQVRNSTGSTTAIMNYFDSGGSGDRMWVLYK